MGGWMGLWWILIIAAIAAVIGFAVVASRRGGASRASPEQALKRRYANGEIDRETYERTLSDLRR
jgi:putative membrane protein